MTLDIILTIFLGIVIGLAILYALRRDRRLPDHSHDVRLPPFLTRDYWRDRGRQDPLSDEQWNECERNRGFPIPKPGEYWTTTDPTPDEPWTTTPPEKGALVLVKMRPPSSSADLYLLPEAPIIYASLSITGRYLYAVDGTIHRWEDALGWKAKPDKMAPFMNGGWCPGDVQETST